MGLKENQELAEHYPVLERFKYNDLPENQKKIAAKFNALAWRIAREFPRDRNTADTLRLLSQTRSQALWTIPRS